MRTYVSAALLGGTALAAPVRAQDSAAAFIGEVAADAPDEAALRARCDRVVAEAERRTRALETETGAATVARTLKAYDDLRALTSFAGAEYYSVSQSADTPEKRQAGIDCYTRIEEIDTSLALSRPVYDRLKAIDASSEDEATRYYLAQVLAEYDRGGVGLDDATRARIKALQDEMTAISAEFNANIAKARGSVKALPRELAGLPQDWIEARPPGPDGLVEITTDTPDFLPVMSYAEDDALRERLMRVYTSRGYPRNSELLGQLFTRRQQLAEILGRPDYASLSFENRMLDTPEKVAAHMAELQAAATPAAQRDLAELRAALAEIRPGQALSPFNTGIARQHVLKTRYDLDPQAVRQYFTYDNVRQGVFELTQDLFGFEIRPWDTKLWHPEVEAFEIYDGGALLGRFYLDAHPRDGKFKHANHIALRKGIIGESLPVSVLTMNLPKGGYDTGLMEHSEVETFLHEFGHLIHSILGGRQRWSGLSGIATERDFVEAPSQMLEEWVYDYDTLARFARNQAGETIPRDLVERMNAARNFGQGLTELVQLGYTNASLRFHQGAPQDPSAQGISQAYRGYYNAYAPIAIPETFHQEAAFGHLDGYSAGYYTYGWSRVIAADLFSRFEVAGLRDPETALAYRRLILEPGGSIPAARMIEAYLGRPVNAEAFKRQLEKGA